MVSCKDGADPLIILLFLLPHTWDSGMLPFDLAPAATLAAGALLWLLYRQQWKARTKGYPLPPGPPSKPLIGNILNVSPKRPWFKLTEYKKQYGRYRLAILACLVHSPQLSGDLVFFHGLGNNILVLNSMESVVDLLDKRGNIYSHRPEFTVAGELMALGQSMPLLPYGNEWRAHRKLAHVRFYPFGPYQKFYSILKVALSQGAVKQYHGLQFQPWLAFLLK